MQICTSPQTDNHASTQPLSLLQAGCPSCRPNNSIKALSHIVRSCPQTKLKDRLQQVHTVDTEWLNALDNNNNNNIAECMYA